MPTLTHQAESLALLATFFVRDALFALEAAVVQEVILLTTVTPVPHGAPEVAGVMNLRGRIVTLLDTGLILGMEAAERTRESRVLVIEDRGEFVGLLVDRVAEVIEIEPRDREPLPLNVPPSQARFFAGVCRSEGRVITLLDSALVVGGGGAGGAAPLSGQGPKV